MYFPFLRGKQYEWIAVRELSKIIASSKRIIPIFEPVKKNLSTLFRSVEEFKKERMPFVIVNNPSVGDFYKNNSMLIRELKKLRLSKYKMAHIAHIISSKTDISEIEQFLNDFDGSNLCLIHDFNFSNHKEIISLISSYNKFTYNIFIDETTGNRYRRRFREFKKVLIEDGFKSRKNELYPPDEFFSDLHLDYKDEGCSGFGDYLMVGIRYSDTGGPAYAVAIHITYKNDDDEIWIKHFVSDTTGTPVDPAGKFMEALEKLVRYITSDENEVYISNACKEFLDLYNRKHFPGLGYVKKLSMKHHIELIKHSILV